MADMLRITALVNPKNYSMPTKPLAESDTVFNIVDLTKVIKTNDRTGEFRQTDNSPADPSLNQLPTLELNVSKNPAFSASLLKGIVSEDFIRQLVSSGSPDVINEFNEFAKNIFLSGDSVASDMVSQQKGATSFNGEIFDLLRNLASENISPELKTALTQFLKSTFSLQSQDSLLRSLSQNFSFLSQAMYPSHSLSQSLDELAQKLLKPDSALEFTQLKNEAVALLDKVSTSLIATDNIKNFVSLVKYNISRFGDNTTAFAKSFSNILEMLPDGEFKGKLSNAFMKFIQGNSISEISKRALNAENKLYSEADRTTYQLSDIAKEFTKTLSLEKLESQLNPVVQQLAKLIDNQGKHPVISLSNGSEMLGDILSLILPQHSEKELRNFIQNFSETKDLNSLINRLNYILNNIDSYEIKSSMSRVLNELLSALSYSDDIVYSAPTSMEKLTEFLSKTLDNENIIHLGIVEPNQLVQSMLTAPGVFTPLLHYVLPVKIDELKAFGEVWIDNCSGKDKNGSPINHIFIAFDVEHLGKFELEMMAKESSIDISLFCPHGSEKIFSSLKPRFSQIASIAGYSVGKTDIRPLKKLRDLVEVFPNIAERRAGLNVKI